MKKAKVIGKSVKKVVTGVVYVRATFNNIFVSITDTQGNILYKTSAGACGFSGSRKSTPYAAGIVADSAAKVAIDKFGMKVASVVIRGPGFGAEAAVKACQSNGKLTVATIVDKTAFPHNGCRLRKKRRV